MTAGVYYIECKINFKIYIGISANIEKRLHEHLNGNSNKFLNEDVEKYCKGNFRTKILKRTSKKSYFKNIVKFREVEAFYIAKFDSANPLKGYNTLKCSCHVGKIIDIQGKKLIRSK